MYFTAKGDKIPKTCGPKGGRDAREPSKEIVTILRLNEDAISSGCEDDTRKRKYLQNIYERKLQASHPLKFRDLPN